MPAQVRVAGQWLSTLTGWGGLTWSTTWPGGCKEASWSMWGRPPIVVGNTPVEIVDNGRQIWAGFIAEPGSAEEDGTITVTAHGAAVEAEGAYALDSLGNATSRPHPAVAYGIERGALRWAADGYILSLDPIGGEQSGVNTIASVLDQWCDEEGMRWGVDAERRIWAAVEPTEASWVLAPGVAELDVTTGEGYASHFVARYKDTGATLQTVIVGDNDAAVRWGRREEPVDLTPLGPITTARARKICNGMLAKGAAKPTWVGSLDITPGQLLSPGGAAAHPYAVKAGQAIAVHSGSDPRRSGVHTLATIGEATWKEDEQVLTIAPVEASVRSLTELLTSVVRQQRRQQRRKGRRDRGPIGL